MRTFRLYRPAVPDTTPPDPPDGLAATGVTSYAVDLAWNAATDDVGVVGYEVHRDGVVVGGSAATSWTDAGLAAATTYVYTVTAVDAAGNVSTPSSPLPVTTLGDTTPPSVAVTAPAAGATVEGTVLVTADAADDTAVAGVQFLLDGAALGAEVTAAPYEVSWDTSGAANGAHALAARARDAGGNLATSAPVAVTVANPLPDLVAAYGFDEGAGTTAADASGYGNDGAVFGASWTASGRFGGALSFNGTDSRVTVADADSLDLLDAMTLEAWVNPTAVSGWRTILMKELDAIYYLYGSGGTAGHPGVGVNIGGYREIFGPSALPLNAWSHVAGTYDGSALRLYVNGVQVASASRTGTLQSTTNPLRIGGNAQWGEYFAGRIDEVRVYRRALSAAEIQADMAEPVVPPSPSHQSGERADGRGHGGDDHRQRLHWREHGDDRRCGGDLGRGRQRHEHHRGHAPGSPGGGGRGGDERQRQRDALRGVHLRGTAAAAGDAVPEDGGGGRRGPGADGEGDGLRAGDGGALERGGPVDELLLLDAADGDADGGGRGG